MMPPPIPSRLENTAMYALPFAPTRARANVNAPLVRSDVSEPRGLATSSAPIATSSTPNTGSSRTPGAGLRSMFRTP